MESSELKNDILRNLEQIKKDAVSSMSSDIKEEIVEDKREPLAEEMNDNPDDLVKCLPKFNQTTYDYDAKRYYFDEIYFKNSKLITL
jgi:hypothetical protein